MKGTKVAVRYAKSLLELSLENGNLDAVAGDMNHFSKTLEENPELLRLLNSPIVTGEKKMDIFNAVFGQFEKITMDFFALITKNGREKVLPAIAKSFDEEVKLHKGIVSVELITAIALDDSTRKSILAKVEDSVTGTLEVKETINADLIGGFIVKMGDKQIDASVANQLNNLKQRLTH
jgi:F-type H+-transporting ATPase subunit delta